MGTGRGKSLTLNSAFRVGFTGTLGVGLAIAVMMALQSVATVIIYIGLALFLSLGLEPIVQWFVERKVPVIEDERVDPRFGQVERGGEAGEPCADDGDIGFCRALKRGGGRRGLLGGGGPKGAR